MRLSPKQGVHDSSMTASFQLNKAARLLNTVTNKLCIVGGVNVQNTAQVFKALINASVSATQQF